MRFDLNEIWRNFRLADALDLAVVTLLFALLFQWVKRRSNKAFLVAILALASLYFISHWLRMYLTLAIFRMGLTVAVIGVLIIFQNDLRHGLERLAAWHPWSRHRKAPPQEAFLATLVEAVTLLAQEKMGALIVLPSRQNLDRLLNGGEKLEGRLSVPLLHSLFHSETRGHDGAVIIEGRQVKRFAVHLPLSTNFAALGAGGTRHAAALGLAEQSDAFVIVVSEERGTVSVAEKGQLQILPKAQDLTDRLNTFYRQAGANQTPNVWVRRFAGQLLSFALGFAAAVFFWLLFAFQLESVQRIVDQVPVVAHGLPENWMIESVSPQQLRVNVMGSERAFTAYDWSTLRVTLDLSNPAEGEHSVVVKEEAMRLPKEISLVRAEPSVVRVTAYKTKTVTLPIEVNIHGELPEMWELVSKLPSEESITVKVRESLVPRIKSIPIKSIDLADVSDSPTQTAPLLLPKGVWPSENMPGEIKVTFELRRKKEAAEK